ncbi:hypothetical protein F5Y02DRAFT_429277 [Annulohypoxylon stygium]|nr:hypothetical protein F5Y02DRAFT_429277 [Annulohypoxylon stygium]
MAAAAWRAESPILDRSIQIEGIRQKGEAMRLIRARLALVGSAVADEEFIFIMSTMSTLVLVEALDGDFQAAEMHLRCVYNLFNSRGGRDRFKDKYVFCKSTNLADIQVAVALGRQLIFPRMYSDQAELTASTIDDAQPPLSDSISNGSTYECVAIFTQLRQLLSAHNSPDISPEVKRAPPDIVDELILQYLYQDHANDLSDSGRRSRALVLAAHLFMSITLRHSSTRSPVVRRMCMRLQGTVGMAPAARQIWAKDKTALLWIAFVGLLGTGERVETCPAGQSFLHLFRSILREYSKDSTQDISSLRETLSTFLWDESYCQPLLVWLESRQLIGPK